MSAAAKQRLHPSNAQVAPLSSLDRPQDDEPQPQPQPQPQKLGRLARFKRSSTLGNSSAASGSLQDLKAQHQLQHQARPLSSSVLPGRQAERGQLLLLAQNQHVQQPHLQEHRMHQFPAMQLDYGSSQHHQTTPNYQPQTLLQQSNFHNNPATNQPAASTSQMSKGHTTDSSSLALSSEQCADGEHEDRPSCVQIMKKLFFSLVLGTIIAICWVMIIHTLKWIAIKGNEFELVSQQQSQSNANQHRPQPSGHLNLVQPASVDPPPSFGLQVASSKLVVPLEHSDSSSPFNHASLTPQVGSGSGSSITGGARHRQSLARAPPPLQKGLVAGEPLVEEQARSKVKEWRVTRQLTGAGDGEPSGGYGEGESDDDNDDGSTGNTDNDHRDNNNDHQPMTAPHTRIQKQRQKLKPTNSETSSSSAAGLNRARYPKQQAVPQQQQPPPPPPPPALQYDGELDGDTPAAPAPTNSKQAVSFNSEQSGPPLDGENDFSGGSLESRGLIAGNPSGLSAGPGAGAGLVSYRAPFFTSWFVSIWNILFMPVFTLISSCCFRSEDSTTKKLLVESISQFMDNGLTTLQFLGRCAFFSVLWIATIFGIVYSLSNIDATVVMALFACSAALVYLLSWVLLHQQFVGVRIVAVIICTTGIALLAYMDNSRTLGSVLIVAGSALCSAVYKVIYQRMFGFWSIAQMSLFFTLIGLFNAFLMWPVALMLYFLGVELVVWRYIPWMHLTAAGALHLTANIVAYFGPICSYDIFLTMGLLLAVVLSAVIDVTFYKITFFGMKLAGVLLLMVGFLVCLLPENWNEFLYDLVNERFIRWKKQRNLKKSRNKVQDLSTGQMSRLRTPSGRVK